MPLTDNKDEGTACLLSYLAVSPDFADDFRAEIVRDDLSVVSTRGQHHCGHFPPVSVLRHEIFLRGVHLLLEFLVHRPFVFGSFSLSIFLPLFLLHTERFLLTAFKFRL